MKGSHPADRCSQNPRVQCAACGKWKRIYTKSGEQLFFGGCAYTNGDHYDVNGNFHVCDQCCHTHCKQKAIAEGKWSEP